MILASITSVSQASSSTSVTTTSVTFQPTGRTTTTITADKTVEWDNEAPTSFAVSGVDVVDVAEAPTSVQVDATIDTSVTGDGEVTDEGTNVETPPADRCYGVFTLDTDYVTLRCQRAQHHQEHDGTLHYAGITGMVIATPEGTVTLDAESTWGEMSMTARPTAVGAAVSIPTPIVPRNASAAPSSVVAQVSVPLPSVRAGYNKG